MGTPTFGTPLNIVAGNKRITITKVTGSSSYATGGDTITALNLGLTTLDIALVIPVNTGFDITLTHAFPATTGKVQFAYPQGGSASGTNDGSGTTTGGASTASAVNATKPDVNTAPATEVQSTKSLTGVSFFVLAVGN